MKFRKYICLLCAAALLFTVLLPVGTAAEPDDVVFCPFFWGSKNENVNEPIRLGDDFDLSLGFKVNGQYAYYDIGEIKTISLKKADEESYVTLYKDGQVYSCGEADPEEGAHYLLHLSMSPYMDPGEYYTKVEGTNGTFLSENTQTFLAPEPNGPNGEYYPLGFQVEPYFFKDGNFNETVTSVPVGSTFALSVYLGENPSDVTLIELFSEGESFREYVLYQNGVVYYGGQIDNEAEGPAFMTGFSAAKFEPGNYYLKVATKKTADGTAKPCLTITGESSAKIGPAITTPMPDNATLGEPYSFTLKATPRYGGAVTWSIAYGSLPTGLTLNGKTGVISGTPTQAGTVSFTVRATEAGGADKTAGMSITVKAETKYTVSYNLNGGKAASGADYATKAVKQGEKIALPAAPSKSGYRFVYWIMNGTAYLPGTELTVTANFAFAAEYTVREPLKVNVPESLNDAAGELWLIGIDAAGNTDWLWSMYNPDPLEIAVPVYNLKDKTFTRLELRGKVDGKAVVLASCTGTVTEETDSVTLTAADLKWQTIRGVEVTGVPENDYYAGDLAVDTGAGDWQYFRLPFMTAQGRKFKLNLSARYNTETAATYDLDSEYISSTVKNGKLVIEPVKLSDSAAVTLSAELDGRKYSGTVTASQTVGGFTRTVRGHYSDWNDSFLTLHLIPGVETRFSLSGWYGDAYVFEGATLSSPKNGAAHTIKARTMTLDAQIAYETDADPALALRYIQSVGGGYTLTATPKGKTNEAGGSKYWSSVQPDLTTKATVYLYGVSESGAVKATCASDYAFGAAAEAQLKEGAGTAKITAKLKPGVVVRLSSETSSSCFLAWFDAAGKYLGSDDTFYLNAWTGDFASVCPAEKAGSYTVALLPHNYHSAAYLEGKTLADLAGLLLTSWPVTLTANGVQELAAYRADPVVSENATFVTKPYSTLHANSESFSTTSDLLCFSGSIGLDPGLENGELIDLTVYTNHDGLSSLVSTVTINGVAYPLTDPQWSNVNNGYYYLELTEPVALPCEYSIYASPYAPSKDVQVSVEANVKYKDSLYNYYSQKVGDATVKRPGTFISVSSTYVCADTVPVTGVAKPYETVKLYDNGAPVADAAADRYGAWAANVPLYGTDDVYTTVHQIHAQSASGVISNTATVIHRKNGPQLLALNLILDGSETDGTYFYVSIMRAAKSVKYRLVFANPGELAPMKEWDNAQAAVKVYLGSGNILFVRALPQEDGSFVADLGNLHWDYIESAEAIYRPKEGTMPLTEAQDGGVTLNATAEEAREFAAALSDMRSLLTTDKNGKLVYGGITGAQSFSVSFDENGKAAVSGGLTATMGTKKTAALETAFSAAEKEYGENGLRYKELSSGTDSGGNILEWLNAVGEAKAADNQAKGDDARFSYSQRSQIFSTKESFENTRTYLARYATDAKYSDNAAAGNHARFVYGKNTAADIYTITDCTFDEEGNYLSGSYRITASLLADTSAAPAIYTASVTVELAPNFKGYAGLKAQGGAKKAPGFLSLFTVEAHASEVDASGLYQGFDGKYSDDPSYAQSGTIETLAGDATNSTGFFSGFIGNSTSFFSKGMQNFGNGMGFVSMGTSIYHFIKTMDNAEYRIGQEVRMRMDLENLLSSTCYKRLTQSKRQLVDEAFKKYKKAEKNFDNWDGWSTGLSLGLDVGGVICGAFASMDKDFAAAGFALTGLSCVHGATLGKGLNKAYQKMINQYEESYRTIKSIFQSHAKQTGLDDCKKLKKDDSNNKTYEINHDPSGIVYEGVIENPVKGATVTLWYGVDANGQLVLEKDAKNVKQVVPASAVRKTPQETVQVTGADGKYAWFVPQGLWYVTAEYAGLTGNSNADKAATVKVSGVKAGDKAVTNLLPVLPEQLDVNIPLTDKTAPVIESVRYTDEGVYVTFSKYMVDTAKGADSVLNAANYTLKTKDGTVTIGSVRVVEQGHTPSNIDGKNVKTYTRTVLLVPKTALKTGTQVLLTVKKSVKSYAGTAMAADFTDSGAVTAQKALSAPAIAGGAKQTVAYGSGVTITLPKDAPANAAIYYTTDGSDPAAAGKRYEGPFGVTNKMTVRAVAVCPGYPDSAVASAEFTVDEAQKYMPAGSVQTEGGDPAGITLTLSGGDYKATAKVESDGSYAFHDVPVGSYTLSFAGNDDFRAASATVTVTTFDPWVTLSLTDIRKTPDYTPGDVDGDGKISSADARLALRRSVKLEDYPEGSAQYLACDADGDGKVTSADARLILRASVGLEDASKWKKA